MLKNYKSEIIHRIEMTAPTENEIECVAKAVNIDKELIKAVLDGKVINEGAAVTVQFIADAKSENNIGIIFVKGNGAMITTSKIEIAEDNIIKQGMDRLYEAVAVSGYINLDFADVLSIVSSGNGYAYTDTGYGKGADKIVAATDKILSSPQLKKILLKSKGVIVCLTAYSMVSLDTVDSIMNILRKEMDKDANVIFAVNFDDNLDDEIKVTVISMDSGESV